MTTKMKLRDEEDLFMRWINKNITVHFIDGSMLEGILRKYSNGTVFVQAAGTEAVVFLSEVKFISIKNIDPTTGVGDELC